MINKSVRQLHLPAFFFPLTALLSRPARSFYLMRLWMAAAILFALGVSGARAQNVFGSEPVGSTSGAQSAIVVSPGGGVVKTVEVLTAGLTGGEFRAGTGVSSCPSATLAAHATCTQSVTFTPATPGLRIGAVVLLDAGGNIVGTGYVSGTGSGGLGVLTPGNVIIVAGTQGHYTGINDGGPATQGQLNLPSSVVLDGAGNMYIADGLHNRIRMVCGAAQTATIAGTTCTTAGIISTIVGNAKPGYTGDGAAAALATVNDPSGVAIDGAGNLYISDTGNDVIREIYAATGMIATVAGNGSTGNSNANLVGDGGAATSANLNAPSGLVVDQSGNLYIVDTFDHRIREVKAATGIITTIAGSGFTASNGGGGYNGDNLVATNAQLNYPYGIAFDPSGNLYIADSSNNRVREVAAVGGAITAASQISTLAGTGIPGGIDTCVTGTTPASSTELFSPQSVAVDAAGNVYIADTQNAGIRKVNPATGALSTLVESGCGEVYSGGNFNPSDLYGPKGLYLDGYGNLYISDYYNMVVREIVGNYAPLDDLNSPTRQGSQSGPFQQTLENEGNAPLDLVSITHDANSAIDAATTCGIGSPYLAVAADCNVGADFAPSVAGNPLVADIFVADNTQPGSPGVAAPNSPLDIQIIGDASAVNSTTTTISSTPNPSSFGQTVNFTITVTTGSGTGNLTGTVSVTDTYQSNTSFLSPNQTLTLNSAGTTGTATLSIGTLGVGQHTIVASYSGDAGHFPGKSTDNGVAPYIQTVNEGTGVTLTSSVNPSAVGQSVTFTATVAGTGGGVVPVGTIQFKDGANPLGAPVALASVGGNGVATFATAALANGPHPITAVYSGDPSNGLQGSTSNTVNQKVLATSTLVLASTLNPSYYGNSVTFTAGISSSGTQPPTGTVLFFDNGQQIGSGTLSGNPAVASFATATLAVATHPITATYGGDSYNALSASAGPLNQVVNLAKTATTVTAAPNPGIAGGTETITATVAVTNGAVTPGGSVTFNSGATVLGVANLTANGTATITPLLAPGSYQIVATYSGNTQASASVSNPLSLTIVQASTQTALAVNPIQGLVAQPIVFTATVTGSGATPTGTVNFSANGNSIGAAPVNGSGVATISVSTLPVGVYSIVANYTGDASDASSVSAATTLNVVLATTATTLSAAPNPALVSQTVTFTAKVTGNGGTPTGTVNFIANGNSIGSASLSAGTATLTYSALVAGTYTVTASYGGDTADAASASSSLSETVGLIPTTTSLGTSSTSGANPQVILVASVLNSSTGPQPTGIVSFMNGTTSLGSAAVNANGVATLVPNLSVGVNYTITAAYAGDTNHSTSTSPPVTVSGTAVGFNLTVTPATLTMKAGENSTVMVNLVSQGSFTDSITFGCGSLPNGVTCHFAPASASLAANGQASTQLTIDTNNPLSGGNSAMNRSGTGTSAYLAGVLLPFSAFFGWLLWRVRRRNAGLLTLTMVLALTAAAFFATGCNGITFGSVAPGTYTVQIIGTGSSSNVIHYQNETLDITQ